ncbi:MAG: hypothetical protein KF816_17600 [Melioribacteraceae bacterium]|nr:hypothetical protein [Chitinophagaceae bacterium]MBX3009844.1 hypothetical protein [Melioribacteraceae bacterium]
MKFEIEYTGVSEDRLLIYRTEEHSFDMEPWVYELDFEIAINTLTLTFVDGKIIQLNGFCGLSKRMKSNYEVPKSQKGILKVLDDLKSGVGSYSINKEDLPVYVNTQSGWVCIGNPEKKGNAVEFINNCVAVIDDDKEFVSLWLKPDRLPDI